ncbi:potassium channel subfamily K member 18-like isoform X2 [Amphiura filiformis]|uniref:potassium channel subfamily K member 18-like isoform X2 n=1 Tax=Amphiura filiformis TaxID=82378 RepID=UPI003B219A68
MTLQQDKNESRSPAVVHHVNTICQGNVFGSKQNHTFNSSGGDDMNTNLNSNQTCKLRSLIRAFLPVTLWTIYLALGSLMFTALEDQGNAERRNKIVQLQTTFPAHMTNLAAFLENNCSANATDHVKLVESISKDVVDFLNKAKYGPDTRSWDFFASLRFCLMAVSTIGYGYLAPRTQIGRGICILYTAIGLPLNLIFMACVGKNLACLIGLIYSKLKGLFLWIISLHKLGLKQHTGKLDNGEMQAAAYRNRSIEMSGAESSVRVTENGDIVSEIGVETPQPMARNGVTNYSAQYLQWPGRDPDTRSLSACSEKTLSDIPRTPSRSTIAEPVIEVPNIQHPQHHNKTAPDVPMLFLLFLIMGYCCLGAWFMRMKNPVWTFLDGVYFWFITITTVGFGDLEFQQDNSVDSENDHGNGTILIQVAVIAFVVVGLALMSACVTLFIERGHQYKRASQRLMCNAVNDSGEMH